MLKATEIEFKYKADGLSLKSFTEFCQARGKFKKFVMAAGWDHFFEDAKHPDSFWRHRVGADMNQLTMKRKTTASNNYVRTEHNIDLAKGMTEPQVKAYMEDTGCKYNTSIFKTCFVYKYDYYTLVYYICYNTELKELGRFLEIEMDEGYNWQSEQEAYQELIVMEKICKNLGASAKARVADSLYEMFRSRG